MVIMPVLIAILAACSGGTGSPGVAQVGSTGSARPSSSAGAADTKAAELKFAQCMRAHGVPNFPDPDQDGLTNIGNTGIDPNSPQFKSAQQACKRYAPTVSFSPQRRAGMQAALLKFSRCMRAHGEPNFPDPSTNGGGVNINSSGIDVRSPQFKAAEQACTRLLGVPPVRSKP
jgi:hypothetical protein